MNKSDGEDFGCVAASITDGGKSITSDGSPEKFNGAGSETQVQRVSLLARPAVLKSRQASKSDGDKCASVSTTTDDGKPITSGSASVRSFEADSQPQMQKRTNQLDTPLEILPAPSCVWITLAEIISETSIAPKAVA